MFSFFGNAVNAILDRIVDVIFPLDTFEVTLHEHEGLG